MKERHVYWNGKPFDYGEAVKCKAYDLANRCDVCCDEFYDGTTEAEREKGIEYSDYNGGTFFIIEE